MKICAYVMDSQSMRSYKNDNHDKRAWPGFEVVLDACRRAGYVIEYAGCATVHEYDVVLVSITSDCDWWPFLAERATWKSGAMVIAGGAGVLNVRPFLQWVDCFVLGRGENILPAILADHATGSRHESPSVVWSESFDTQKRYEIAQATKPYPYDVVMTNGKPFREGAIGCPNKCLFCGYTWHRKFLGSGEFSAGKASFAAKNSHVERTIIELLKTDTAHWNDGGSVRIVGLDGLSERMRLRVNKQITQKMFREFLKRLASTRPSLLKIYCIVGYPNETEDDWKELQSDVEYVDANLQSGRRWGLHFQITPFRSFPGTPSATWPMSAENYRGQLAAMKKNTSKQKTVFFEGNKFWAFEGGTSTIASTIMTAMCFRGTESDGDIIMKLARSVKYWRADSKSKAATLDKWVDVGRMLRAYTWEDLPTRYLKTYSSDKSMQALSERMENV